MFKTAVGPAAKTIAIAYQIVQSARQHADFGVAAPKPTRRTVHRTHLNATDPLTQQPN
jgi:hypothetical protein